VKKLLAVGYWLLVRKRNHISHTPMKTRSFAIALLITSASTLGAQQPDTVVLEGVVISATKAPVPSSALTQSVTVITGEELRARGATTVAEALRGVPGVALASNGSFGSLTSLFLRGGESRYTKFLIDGVPVNAVGGYFDLSHLTTDNIERIEIVRGPASAVHGADAVSGAVQIFTRGGAGPARIAADVRGGSYGTLDAGLGVSGGGDALVFSLHGARHSTDGILEFNNDYLNDNVSGSLKLRPDAATTISLATRGTHAEFHYPTDFAGNVVDSNTYRDQRRLTVSLGAQRTIRPGIEVGILGGMNDVREFSDDVTSGASGDTRDRYTSVNRRQRAEARLALVSGAGRLTTGVEYQRERERSASAAGPVDGELADYSNFAGLRTTRAAYAEYLATLRRVALTLSGRLDDPSDFDRAGTYRAGAAVRLFEGSSLRGSLSTAYNAPAFYHLLDTDFTAGNPDLSPERSRNAEVGLKQELLAGFVSLSATYFDQKFVDLIEYVPGGPPDYVGTYANLRAATSRGFELELTTAARGGWWGSASLTMLKTRVAELQPGYQGDAKVGDELLRRPRRTGSASVNWTGWNGASAAVMARYLGKRPDFDFRSFPSVRVNLPAATVVDLAASLPVLRGGRTPVALTLRVDNLLDKEYQEVFNFETPGRRLLVGGRIEAWLR
jgi:vitamin B12 transporter